MHWQALLDRAIRPGAHRWPPEVDPQSASLAVLKEGPSSLCVRSAPPPHSRSTLHQHHALPQPPPRGGPDAFVV